MFSAQASRASRRAASLTTARPGRTTTRSRVSASASAQGGARSPWPCHLCRVPCVRPSGHLPLSAPPTPTLSARRAGVLCLPPLLDFPFRAPHGASPSPGCPRENPWLDPDRPGAVGCWPPCPRLLPGSPWPSRAGETGRRETQAARGTEAAGDSEAFLPK